tara:strand:+ start:93 stop:395 length:303 start_codon:yes stop_codon:yes gene_type:complete
MKIKKNGKVIRLTESDLQRIVKRVLNEGDEKQFCSKFPKSVYGEGESPDMSASRDNALFNAKVNLSKKLNKESFSTNIVKEEMFARGSNYLTKICVEEHV